MLTVHVRISDAATGKPTPVRLRLVDAGGVCRMPFGRQAEFALGPGEEVGGQVRLGDTAFAYIDGVCEVQLPPGPIRVEVHKGPEYRSLSREVVLGPGKIALRSDNRTCVRLASARLVLRRRPGIGVITARGSAGGSGRRAGRGQPAGP